MDCTGPPFQTWRLTWMLFLQFRYLHPSSLESTITNSFRILFGNIQNPGLHSSGFLQQTLLFLRSQYFSIETMIFYLVFLIVQGTHFANGICCHMFCTLLCFHLYLQSWESLSYHFLPSLAEEGCSVSYFCPHCPCTSFFSWNRCNRRNWYRFHCLTQVPILVDM